MFMLFLGLWGELWHLRGVFRLTDVIVERDHNVEIFIWLIVLIWLVIIITSLPFLPLLRILYHKQREICLKVAIVENLKVATLSLVENFISNIDKLRYLKGGKLHQPHQYKNHIYYDLPSVVLDPLFIL